MRRLVLAVGSCASAVLIALAWGGIATGAQADRDDESARAVLRDTVGNRVGLVKITKDEGHIEVKAEVRGLPSGFHGFHVHAVGQCTPPFTSAAGHLNPTGETHGRHAGDMPVLYVMNNRSGEAQFVTDRFSLADLFDADGSAIIVHAAADNYGNIPTRYHSHTTNVFGPDTATLATGDSGDRIACGLIKRAQ